MHATQVEPRAVDQTRLGPYCFTLYEVSSVGLITSPAQGNTRKSTLLGSIDRTVTAGGARLLKNRIT